MSSAEPTFSTGKLKRKDPHPVRREFVATSDSQFKCVHCGWTTRVNATRMVKHIVEHCKNVPVSIRQYIDDIQKAAMEKERNSSLVSENKKDIHKLFNVVENKRICVFCDWCTVRNLTRMRHHIAMQCPKVPISVRACFLKQDTHLVIRDHEQENDDSVESFQLVNVEDERWDDSEMNSQENLQIDDEVHLNVEEQHLEENYLEVQELEERNCNWCKKLLTYESCEVQDGIEVFCSSWCYDRQTEYLHNKNVAKYTKLTGSTQSPVKKRTLAQEVQGAEEPLRKELKLVVVSQPTSVQAVRIKQESSSSFSTGKEIRATIAPTLVEVEHFSPELGDDPMHEETPQVSKAPVQRASVRDNDTPAIRVVPSPAKVSRPSPSIRTVRLEKPTATSDEGFCQSYAGGHVYPQEDVRSADHKLQWTKAVISRPAPQFEATAVVDGAFKKIKLSDYHGKYLVFFFYPLDFTFVCPTEILAFSDRVKEFRQLNTEVIAASIDSHFTHLAWINTPRKEGGLGKINIPLVSDITHSIAKDYGVYLDDLGHTLRGLFIIDDRGILRQITMNDLPVGRSVDETLRLVQAFQYTDKHGEVCPAGWKPGQDTIVPNPEEKIKYFEKNH